MRIFFLGNNRMALNILTWLKSQNEDIVGLTIHEERLRLFGRELLAAADLYDDQVFEGQKLKDPQTIAAIKELKPDIAVSILFHYMLTEEIIDLFPMGAVNLHPAYLPYNRGAYPNVWTIIDKTPGGVSMHYMDKGLDTGSIITRKEVPVSPIDTGQTYYQKLEQAGYDLFCETWDTIKTNQVKPISQSEEEGTLHRIADCDAIDCIDLNKTYPAGELIDTLRARTFPPYKGAYFLTEEGKKVYLRLSLHEEEEVEKELKEVKKSRT